MITVKRKVHFRRKRRGGRKSPGGRPRGRIPRIARLMALAIRLEEMLRRGEVASVTELAQLCHVTQPRMTHILNLTLLAPDIQEQLLFLPRVESGRAPIHERMLRPLTHEIDWECQRAMWSQILSRSGLSFAGGQD